MAAPTLELSDLRQAIQAINKRYDALRRSL